MASLNNLLRRFQRATQATQGPVLQAALVPTVGAYVAPANGAVAVTSAAATDFATLAADYAALKTNYNLLVANLKTAGIVSPV